MRAEVFFLTVLFLMGAALFGETWELQFLLKSGNIGAGFFPRIVIALLIVITFIHLAMVILKKKKDHDNVSFAKSYLAKQLFLLASIIISLFLFDFLGMIVTLALLITLTLFALEKVPFLKSLLLGAACSAGFYVIFVQWMNLRLPTGIFM